MTTESRMSIASFRELFNPAHVISSLVAVWEINFRLILDGVAAIQINILGRGNDFGGFRAS